MDAPTALMLCQEADTLLKPLGRRQVTGHATSVGSIKNEIDLLQASLSGLRHPVVDRKLIELQNQIDKIATRTK